MGAPKTWVHRDGPVVPLPPLVLPLLVLPLPLLPDDPLELLAVAAALELVPLEPLELLAPVAEPAELVLPEEEEPGWHVHAPKDAPSLLQTCAPCWPLGHAQDTLAPGTHWLPPVLPELELDPLDALQAPRTTPNPATASHRSDEVDRRSLESGT